MSKTTNIWSDNGAQTYSIWKQAIHAWRSTRCITFLQNESSSWPWICTKETKPLNVSAVQNTTVYTIILVYFVLLLLFFFFLRTQSPLWSWHPQFLSNSNYVHGTTEWRTTILRLILFNSSKDTRQSFFWEFKSCGFDPNDMDDSNQDHSYSFCNGTPEYQVAGQKDSTVQQT